MSAVSIDAALGQIGAGRILAAHRQACTLETDAGALITLADPRLGNGPDAILVAQSGWPSGTAFWPDGPGRLRFAHGLTLDWSAATRWSHAASAPDASPRYDQRQPLIDWLGAASSEDGLLPVLLGRLRAGRPRAGSDPGRR